MGSFFRAACAALLLARVILGWLLTFLSLIFLVYKMGL